MNAKKPKVKGKHTYPAQLFLSSDKITSSFTSSGCKQLLPWLIRVTYTTTTPHSFLTHELAQGPESVRVTPLVTGTLYHLSTFGSLGSSGSIQIHIWRSPLSGNGP